MRTRSAHINLATGEYTDADSGEVFANRVAWEKAVVRDELAFWKAINEAGDPANEVQFNYPKQVPPQDLRARLYGRDPIIAGSIRGRSRGLTSESEEGYSLRGLTT